MKKTLLLLTLYIYAFADIGHLQQFVYRVKTNSSEFNAVAIEKHTLITSYHGVDSDIDIEAIQGNDSFKALVGSVSLEKDLALLTTKNSISHTTFSSKKPKANDIVNIVSHDNFITTKIFKVTDEDIIFNFTVSPGVSGSGVFLDNQLIGIVSKVDILSNVPYATIIQNKDSIQENHEMKKLPSIKDNYDTSYCTDPVQLETWERVIQTDNLAIHKLHAVFLGLCQKVQNRDLTTDEASIIFDNTMKEIQR